jgi:hypothetical protein
MKDREMSVNVVVDVLPLQYSGFRYFHPSRFAAGGTEEEIWDMGENITCRVEDDLTAHVEARSAQLTALGSSFKFF